MSPEKYQDRSFGSGVVEEVVALWFLVASIFDLNSPWKHRSLQATMGHIGVTTLYKKMSPPTLPL